MAQTRINGSVAQNSSKYEFYLTWEETFAGDYLTTNQSTVTLRAYARKKSDYSSYTSVGTMTNVIDGTSSGATGLTIDLQTNTTAQLIRTTSKLITHSSDGSKSINVSATGQLGSSSYGPGVGTVSSTAITLATIPRQAVITDASVDFVIGNSIPINFTNAALFWVKAETYVDGTLIKTQNLGQATSATLTFNSTEINNMYAEIPNTLTAASIIRLKTYSDAGYSTQIATDSDKACTATVNSATNNPTFVQGTTPKVENVDKSVVVTDKYSNTLVTSSTETLIGGSSHKNIGIQYIGKLRATVATADKMTVLHSATASKYRFTNGSYYGEIAEGAGDKTIDIDNVLSANSSISAIDSRGLVTSLSNTLSIFAGWSYIDVFGISVARTNSFDPEVTLGFFASYWKKYFSSNTTSNPGYGYLNTITMHYRYKESTKTWNTSDGTVTVTIASPAVMTKTTHGLSTGDQIFLTTTGALPTGLTASTYYYIIKVDANTFNLASSYANAIAGTKIATSGTQSGVHTMWHCGMWTAITPTVDTNGSVAYAHTIDGDLGATGFNADKAFDIEVRVFDKLSQDITEIRLNVGTPAMHLTKNGLAVKAKHSGTVGNALEVTGNQTLTGELSITNIPIKSAVLTGWTLFTGSCSYSSASAPTFIMTVPSDVTVLLSVGMKISFVQTTRKYFIITALTATTVTLYGGTDYTLVSAAISSVYYSTNKAPYGFPMDANKWTSIVTDTTQRTQATPTQDVWYNLGDWSAPVPIGLWNLSYSCITRVDDTTATQVVAFTTLSKANNTEDDSDFTVMQKMQGASGSLVVEYTAQASKVILCASATVYYINTMSTVAGMNNFYQQNSVTKAFIKAVCAYL